MGAYGSIRVDMGGCRNIQATYVEYGRMWEHTGPYGSEKHMEAHGRIWKHMEAHGRLWEHVGAYGGAHGHIWKHMKAHKRLWEHVVAYGGI